MLECIELPGWSCVPRHCDGTLVAILFAGELRLPDHPEDRARRLAYINAWTVGATSLYVSVSEKEAADVRLLSRVTWADAVDVAPSQARNWDVESRLRDVPSALPSLFRLPVVLLFAGR